MSNTVDLEFVGMGLKPVSPKVGKTSRLDIIIANNGPGKIAVKDATVHLTIEKKHLSLSKTAGFRHLNNPLWKLKHREETPTSYELHFTNKAVIGLVGGTEEGFSIVIKAIQKTSEEEYADITGTCSLALDSQSSEDQGQNQTGRIWIKVR